MSRWWQRDGNNTVDSKQQPLLATEMSELTTSSLAPTEPSLVLEIPPPPQQQQQLSPQKTVGTYGSREYWDQRYIKTAGEIYDWYFKYKKLRKFFTKHFVEPRADQLNPSSLYSGDPYSKAQLDQSRTLVVGCGNSNLSVDLYNDGYRNIYSVDYSPVVIELMRKKHHLHPELQYLVQDVRSLEFADEYFDLVVDKGTLDSILCGDQSIENCHSALTEFSRVLKSAGKFLVITYGKPETRLEYLKKDCYKWSVEYELLDESRFIYVMTKMV
eukprot:TRINITY_DN19_c1_g1_i1.p1 TRINITY_DN19_c1_g1~~TRINITY_DN19_c1_g1_i1.p1  ORF type:complete len:271 (-),score=70.32 TRINITY_DN19_c1_g1_i1:81-893(-)